MEKFKGLIVVDVQGDFVGMALGTKEAVEIVPKVAEVVKNWDGVIFATRDTHTANYLETREGKYLKVPHCIIDTKGWNIVPSVQSALDAKGAVTYINKPTFGSMELVYKLHQLQSAMGYDMSDMDITLVGLCTDICVLSNAILIKNNFPEANVSVIADCCAGTTPEKHKAALASMESCQINIL